MQAGAPTEVLSESNRRKYQEILEDVGQIPTLPTIVMRAMEILNDDHARAEDLGRLLARDPALSVKVLRLANSAFYGIPRTISSINQAVIILGFDTLRSLVLSATVFRLFDGRQANIDHARYWKHSVVAAMATRRLARHVARFHSVNPESAFMTGLLHKIGVLLFDVIAPEAHASLFAKLKDGSATLAELEMRVLGIQYAQLGGMLAERWELPEELQRPIAGHLHPMADAEWAIASSLVHVGAILAERSGVTLVDSGAAFPLDLQALEALSLTERDLGNLLTELAPEIESASGFFELVQG
jgi:HD-like signal output (HDOD) protein